jgi:hypothetical protein
MGMDWSNQESQELLVNDLDRFIYETREEEENEINSNRICKSPTRVRTSTQDLNESAF